MTSFKQAFDAARKAGNRYFSWNGNDYSTMLKEEQDSGNVLDFLKLNTNTENNSNFLKAERNLPFQILGIFRNPTDSNGNVIHNYNVGTPINPVIHSRNYDANPDTSISTSSEISNIQTPSTTYSRSQVRAAMRARGLDPYAYTGGQRKALRMALNSGQDFDTIFNQWKSNNQPISYNANGGLLRFQNGGTTQDQVMEAFKQWVAQKIQNGEVQESDLKDQNKLKQLFQLFSEEQQRGVQTAMNGTKLNYINQLNGKCPQGTHLSYYKIGGTLCKKCEADKYNENKDPIKAFKEKCGGKVKKNEFGGEVNDKDKKTKLVKKSQPIKSGIKKPQTPTKPIKPTNNRPGPKDLKTLPNGKYPSYWTSNQRGEWDRDHDEGV